jgi:hypothetical protein
MDIFYYSNYCKHCQKVVQFIIKHGIVEQISSICIDQRKRDQSNQYYVILENGQRVTLPPNLQSVPAVLCTQRNYTLVTGTDTIMQYLNEKYNSPQHAMPNAMRPMHFADLDNPHIPNPGERNQEKDPIGYDVMSAGPGTITSESYTSYSLQPEELNGFSRSPNRPLYNYMPVDANFVIPTPEDTYRPDKVASNVTIDVLQQQRNHEVPAVSVAPPQGLYGDGVGGGGSNQFGASINYPAL